MHARTALATALATCLALPLMAEEIVVEMRNRGADGNMVFEPGFVQAVVGDTFRFVPVDRGHNVETIEGIWPDGATPVAGAINEEVVLELTAEGLYGLRCKPHVAMGMVALIAVGAPLNLEAARAVILPRKAAERMEPWLSEF